MEVVCRGPFRGRSLVWQPRPGTFALTVVCKATFVLTPGESPFHVEPLDLFTSDVHHEGDPRRSLQAASDFAPIKKRADVVLSGHAFAPGGRRVSSLSARLVFQGIDKVVSVTGDSLISLDDSFSEPVLWSKMPLCWERAAAADGQNPVGVRMGREARADGWGRVALPNLRPAGAHLSTRWDVLAPAGFGPLSPDWPARAVRLHRFRQLVDPRRAREWPLADDFDMSFFNAAPLDQMVDAIAGDEEILLENLLPQIPVLRTRLSRVVPRAQVDLGSGHVGLNLRCDTLAIDTDLGTASLTWRDHVALDHPERAGRVVISGQALTSQITVPVGASLQAPTPAPGGGAVSVRETVGLRGALPGFVLPFGMGRKGEKPSLPVAGSESEKPTFRGMGHERSSVPGSGDVGPAAVGASHDEDEEPVFPQQAFAATMPLGLLEVRAQEPEREPEGDEEPVFPAAQRRTVDLAAWMGPPPGESPLPFRAAGGAAADGAAADGVVSEAAVVMPPPLLGQLQPSFPEESLPTVESRGRELVFAPPPTPENTAPAPPPLLGPLAAVGLTGEGGGELEGTGELERAGELEGAGGLERAAPTVEDYPAERCARIAAKIACRPEDEEIVLDEEKLGLGEWQSLSGHWLSAIRKEASRGKKKLLVVYDAAYVAQIEVERGPLRAGDYARLVVAAERGESAETAAAMALPGAAVARIRRVWLRKIVEDAAVAREVRAAMRKLGDD